MGPIRWIKEQVRAYLVMTCKHGYEIKDVFDTSKTPLCAKCGFPLPKEL